MDSLPPRTVIKLVLFAALVLFALFQFFKNIRKIGSGIIRIFKPNAGENRPFGQVEQKIARRYLGAKKSEGGVAVIAWISFFCIMLAITAGHACGDNQTHGLIDFHI